VTNVRQRVINVVSEFLTVNKTHPSAIVMSLDVFEEYEKTLAPVSADKATGLERESVPIYLNDLFEPGTIQAI
jgi:hypothetical protein